MVAPADRSGVPGFGDATAWLNVDHALTMKELAGRVVVVDFWTSCCINCLHTLPTLARLEARLRPPTRHGARPAAPEVEVRLTKSKLGMPAPGIVHVELGVDPGLAMLA